MCVYVCKNTTVKCQNANTNGKCIIYDVDTLFQTRP